MGDVIDLDVTNARTVRSDAARRRHWRRVTSMRIPVHSVVALVLSAGLVGGVAGQQWAAVQQQALQASELSLFLAVAGVESATGADGRVAIEGSIAVVNGGPAPVEVAGSGHVADVMVWGQQRIAPAASGRFAVSVTITCADEPESRPLPVDLLAVTADGVRRPVTAGLQLTGSSWHQLVVQACAQPR